MAPSFLSVPLPQELCQDANIRVALTKVLKDDELVLVLYLTNQKQEMLSGVSLTVTPPTTMKVSSGSSTSFSTDLPGFGNVSKFKVSAIFHMAP